MFGVIGFAMVLMATGQDGARQPGPGLNSQIRSAEASAYANYALGQGDEIGIWVLGLEEANRNYRVDAAGNIDIPIMGRIAAAGLTTDQLREVLLKAASEYVKRPEITITMIETRSQPISVLGAVNKPGVMQLQGRKSLMEVLSLAEGLRADSGPTITVTRRKEYGTMTPLESTLDVSGEYYVAEVSVRALLSGAAPESNILIRPYDVITVNRASTVYVLGQVKKAGGFQFADRRSISVLEAVSLAEGPTEMAKVQDARILRRSAVPGTQREEIPINLKEMLLGKAADPELQPEDIIFVPDHTAKRAWTKALDTAISVASGVVIWRVGLPQ